MLEPAVVVLRLLQYAGAAVLFGAALMFSGALRDGHPQARAAQRALVAAAALLAVASAVGLIVQTAMMAGSWSEGLKAASLTYVAGVGLGRSALARMAAAALALGLLAALPRGPVLWRGVAVLGGLACASLAWMGHGAATEGRSGVVHLVSDVLHCLAAGLWIGALAAFLLLVRSRDASLEGQADLARVLRGFSGTGSALVAVLVATGLINSAFLVGPKNLSGLWTTPYGQLLLLKLALFTGMLALAAANRYRLTPRLTRDLAAGASPEAALIQLRRSLALETGLALAVLAAVAWLGTLAPVAAM